MTKDADYTKRFKQKRKTKSKQIDFYLDDDRESTILSQLESTNNQKETVLSALEIYFNKKN